MFGLDEMKTLSSGGCGTTLMELEDGEKLLAAQPIGPKGVLVSGSGAAARRRKCRWPTRVWRPTWPSARKGKQLESKLKASKLTPLG